MASWQWSNEFSVANEIMDEHHKHLFSIMNKLHDILKDGCDEQAYLDLLNELLDYANYHFTAEENLLIQIKYPKLMIQKIQHDIFKDKINLFIHQYQAEKLLMSLKMMSFLREWLIKHILELDMDYRKYLD